MSDKKIKTRVFNICQYEINPKTGEDLHFNEKSIIVALAHKTIKEWAYICHDKDICSEEDETKGNGNAGELKGKHWHVVGRFDHATEIVTIAKWFGVPPNAIDIPKGRGAFLDCIEYLTHESEKQQALGKYRYPDEEIVANFDWRERLLERDENRLKYGVDLTKHEQIRYDIIYNGLSLKDAQKRDPLYYMDNFKRLRDLRHEYIRNLKVPGSRLNFYIYGNAGYGKGVASRALARALFPDMEDGIYYEVGQENAGFEKYDGEPVIIWHDKRAIDLLTECKGRGNVFNIFDTHPSDSVVNIKYGSIKLVNQVNIVNSVQDYNDFLDGLAGEYTMKDGTKQYAEDKGQSYRRFPVLIPLRFNDMDILLLRYFVGLSEDPTEYECWKRVCGSFARVRQICKNNELLAREYEAKLLDGLADKSWELLQNEQQLSDDEIRLLLSDMGKALPIDEAFSSPVAETVFQDEGVLQLDSEARAQVYGGRQYQYHPPSDVRYGGQGGLSLSESHRWHSP